MFRRDLARLVLTGDAAVGRNDIDRLRRILLAGVDAMRRDGLSARILVTPAGFVHKRLHGEWTGSSGWDTRRTDFEALAAAATGLAREIATDDLLERSLGVVEYMVIGVDVAPTSKDKPHAEIACLVDVASQSVCGGTGKTYPTTQQERTLIRNADPKSHIVPIGDDALAVLVCHDLSAWSPRGNAVAGYRRAHEWRALQEVVSKAKPTVAVHLTHTVEKPGTWRSAWSRFVERSGGRLRSATSAIRYVDQSWDPVHSSPSPRLLQATGRGQPAVDVIVRGAR